MHLVEKETGGVEDNLEAERSFGFFAQLVSNLYDAADRCEHFMIATCVQQLNHLILSLQLCVVVEFGDVL